MGLSLNTILLIEDDEGHARLIEKNLKRVSIQVDVMHINNGDRALAFVQRKGEFAERDLLALVIILDLNLPGLDGYQILSKIKNNTATKHIPVIVLTSTDDNLEIERCYTLGCNAYIIKPTDYEIFSTTIQHLGQFLQIICLRDNS